MRPHRRPAHPILCPPAHALQHALAVKYALFNVYLTTVTLNTPPTRVPLTAAFLSCKASWHGGGGEAKPPSGGSGF